MLLGWDGVWLRSPRDVPSLLLKAGEVQPGTRRTGGALLRGKMGYRAACASGEPRMILTSLRSQAPSCWKSW